MRRLSVWIEIPSLSTQERRLCELLAAGHSYKDAAAVLGISYDHAKQLGHRSMVKLGAESMTEVVAVWPHLLAVEQWLATHREEMATT